MAQKVFVVQEVDSGKILGVCDTYELALKRVVDAPNLACEFGYDVQTQPPLVWWVVRLCSNGATDYVLKDRRDDKEVHHEVRQDGSTSTCVRARTRAEAETVAKWRRAALLESLAEDKE